jgi:hypothetical protein
VVTWRDIRAGAIGFAILIGLVDGCPLPSQPYPWQRAVVETVRPVQQTAMRPFAWIAHDLRFSQKWALFQSAGRDRFRLEIEGLTKQGWQLLYRAGDDDHREDSELLEYRRARGAWNPTDHATSQYRDFAAWLTARILREHPELSAARIQLEKIHIDDGIVTGTGERVYAYTRMRQP